MTHSLFSLSRAVFLLGQAIESDIRPWNVSVPGLDNTRPAAAGRADLDAARELIRSAEPTTRRHLCRSLRWGIWGAAECPRLKGGAR